MMETEKKITYKVIITNILSENKKGLPLKDIYKKVKNRKMDCSNKWQNVVRNILHSARNKNKERIFRKEGNVWILNR